jgi:hypothetical protein
MAGRVTIRSILAGALGSAFYAALGCSGCESGTVERDDSFRREPEPEPKPIPPVEPKYPPGTEWVYEQLGSFRIVRAHGDHVYFSDIDPPGMRRVPRPELQRRPPTPELVGPFDGTRVVELLHFLENDVVWLHFDANELRSKFLYVSTETLERTRELPLPREYGAYHAYTLDAEYFYAVRVGCEAMTRVSRADGSVQVLETPQITIGGSTHLVVVGDYVYCSNSTTLTRLRKDLSEPSEVLITDLPYFSPLYLLGDYLYFVRIADPMITSAEFRRISTLDHTQTVLATIEPNAKPPTLLYDESTECFYFPQAGGSRAFIGQYCSGASRVQHLGKDMHLRGGMDLYQGYLYWTQREGIRRAPAPKGPISSESAN